MGKRSPNKPPRIPLAVNGIQVNFCKNPNCLNFGRPASNAPQPRGLSGASSASDRDTYTISGTTNGVLLHCKLCGENPPVKSNRGITEEIERLGNHLAPPVEPSCPSEHCSNHKVGLSTPKAYDTHGKTPSGSQRYRCRVCRKTFAIGGPTLRQKRPELNEKIFRLLVNKMPLKRICETAEIGSMNALYWKINFIHQQCLEFAANQERRLPELGLHRLYISVDRQDHVINWTEAGDKRNIVLNALGSADNKSGYIFGIHVNYDPNLDSEAINRDAVDLGDIELRHPYRRYARLWLNQDYEASRAKSKKANGEGKSLAGAINEIYDVATGRDDVEDPEAQSGITALPGHGMQIHAEYTLYAHFFYLHELLGNVGKLRFFLDQESGIRSACLVAFWQEVLEKRCDAFYVRIKKDLTINEKRKHKADYLKEMEQLRESDPVLAQFSDHELRLYLIKERMRDLVKIGKWKDKWLFTPFPDMSEPEKAVCWLTDLHDRAYGEDHLAELYCKATLHGIDRFFMQARRRLSLLERPIESASSEGRKWYGYSPYNPVMVSKMLDIFRVFYNFVEVGHDKKTPAMRLGVSNAPVKLGEIVA